jgi:hypothetical protein
MDVKLLEPRTFNFDTTIPRITMCFRICGLRSSELPASMLPLLISFCEFHIMNVGQMSNELQQNKK